MNLITNNPYRILGLSITASEREIAKQINTLETYAEMGKTRLFETDYPFLLPVKRTPSIIEEAKKQIDQTESKLLYSLFWFWINNRVDELVLEVLKEGSTNKAIGIWEKSVFANKNKVYKPVVYIENLIRHSNNWSEENNEEHSLKKNDDEYIIERKKETGGSVPIVNIELNYNDNWTIECKTRWLNGMDNDGYGIIFGREGSNYFTFEISANGYYCFSKYIEWVYTKLISWKDNDVINKWSTNHLQIKKIDTELTFYINEVYVDSFQSEPFYGKSFGFSVNNNQKISFRNFKFSKLIEDESYGEGINITSKNLSSVKNLSNLYLSLALSNGKLQLDYFKKGIALARSFFSTESIKDYSKLIAGERYIYNSEKTLHFYINDIVDSLKNYIEKTGGISTSQLINAFSSFPVEAKQFLNSKFVSKQLQFIEKEIEVAQTVRLNSAAKALDAGKNLVKNTKPDIEYLEKVLGKNDFQYQIIADKLSGVVIQCGIAAFNFCKTPNGEIDYIKAIKGEEDYLQEYEYAYDIAISQRAKERAKENLDLCRKYILNKHYHYCWFCGNALPEEACQFTITMYKETKRTYFPSRVEYSYVPINIPRCCNCKKNHDHNSNKFTLTIISCAFIGLIIGALLNGYWFGGLLAGGFIGWIFASVFKDSKSKIKDTSQSTIKNYPVISQMINEGWQFSQPTA